MKINVSITLDDDVYLNTEIIKLRTSKQLSTHINNLLRETFNIKREIISNNVEELDKEILATKIKQAVLEEKKKNIILEEEKEEAKWTYPAGRTL